MACRHEIVIPNSLRGISPSYWPTGDGRMHFDGLCQECMADVWRHANPNEDPPWRPRTTACGCRSAKGATGRDAKPNSRR